MIEKLTKEQEAALDKYVDKWIAIGLDTSPINKRTATEAINKIYEINNLGNPNKIIWCKSPVDCLDKFYKKNKDYSINLLEDFVFAQHDAHWLAFYEFFREECGLKEETEELTGMIQLAKETGWCIFTDEACFVCEKPNRLKLDPDGNLHCTDGPALSYSDGFSIYVFHGTTIPDEWITSPGSLTPEKALHWENVEQRRAACELLGWEQIIESLNCSVIEKNDDPEIGTLLEADIPDSGKERFLQVRCGTGRTLIIPVPPDMETAKQANAALYGLTENQLNLEVRT